MVEFWVVFVLRSLDVTINCKLPQKQVNFFRIMGICLTF